MQLCKIGAVAAASVVAATGLVACSSSDSSEFAAGTAEEPIVIGTTIFVDRPQAQLPEILDRLEETTSK